MIRDIKKFDIAKLISLNITGQLSKEDKKRLKSWLESSLENRKIYLDIVSKENFIAYEDRIKSYNTREDWEKITKYIYKNQNRRIIMKIAKYAAIFILPLFIAFAFYEISNQKTKVEEDYIVINPLKAVLVLSSGEQINLFDHNGKISENSDEIKLTNTKNGLRYDKLKDYSYKEKNKEEVFNTLNVPRQGEYTLTLSDGTVVHLNSESKLTYPIKFKGKKRIVKLDGEGYFQVKKNVNRPFIVKTNDYSVKVLGTKFNVNNYENDSKVFVTLVSGKVEVDIKNKKTVILTPGKQLSGNRNNMILKDVDTDLFTSWVNGKFKFKDTPLRDIALQITRWYDVEVFFANKDIKNIHFSGAILKSSPLRSLLNMIEKAGEVKCNLNKKCVIISGI